jgi:hypothetical protein
MHFKGRYLWLKRALLRHFYAIFTPFGRMFFTSINTILKLNSLTRLHQPDHKRCLPMPDNKTDHLRPWAPATYRIKIEGFLENSWSDRFGGLRISSRRRADSTVVTTLTGRVMDQSELSGILNGLADMHLPILSVECLNHEKAWECAWRPWLIKY